MVKGRGYICQNCGYRSSGWLGRCPQCGSWGTFQGEEEKEGPSAGERSLLREPPTPLSQIPTEEVRLQTSMEEFNRTLGGGVVMGSVILFGGAPGVGKSTLMLQVLHELAKRGTRCLYVSGEESLRQVALRARRLGVKGPDLSVMSSACLEEITEEVEKLSPEVLVIDSIQAISSEKVPSGAGSVVQVREVASRLTQLAKSQVMAAFLIGHVTKEGAIAGPRVVEHMVDVVLYMERRQDSPYCILRAAKNRFGSTNEVGVFEMGERGLKEVPNPSELFLSERPEGSPGSVVMPSMEGTRPILVEIQALVAPAVGGYPRRTAMGIDYNRLLLLVGVLERRVGVNLSHHDLFVNVAGGMRVEETAGDLAVAVAILSSHLDRPLPSGMVVFGEVGLTGEVRGVGYGRERVAEAARLGFRRCLLPRNTARGIGSRGGVELVGIREVREVIKVLERGG